MTLIINEIFYSLQGETTRAGFPSVFVRLAGCNLNCAYCDTAYARTGAAMEIDTIIQTIEKYPGADHVTVTGGEPLIQSNTIALLKEIITRGWSVQLETNGSILIKDVPHVARKIVDIKTPSSGEVDSFEMRNLKYMSENDEIKFVISSMDDYDFSADFVGKYLLKKEVAINFSPVYQAISIQDLADRIISDNLPVRLNLQLHKIIWGPDQREK